MSEVGIIAGNRLLPIILARKIKEKDRNVKITSVCFKGETSVRLMDYVDKAYWVSPGKLGQLCRVIKEQKLKDWILAGQINPLRIFNKKQWDDELKVLAGETEDFRPHTIFLKIINYLERDGARFLDLTVYLKDVLADIGVMAGENLAGQCRKDMEFGLKIISRFVDLDVGQTIVVKNQSVVALEALEGTDRTILRGCRLAGNGCMVFKFSRMNQDLRFDVPVVGLGTLKLLRRRKVCACVLEAGRVIILEKEKFIQLAKKWAITIVGIEKGDRLLF